MQRQELEYLLH
jgi:hypothetical protein